MLPKLRIMAENQSNGSGHPWSRMTDDELLKSARLYSIDRVTGEQGFNLAAVMLLGKDDVIFRHCTGLCDRCAFTQSKH